MGCLVPASEPVEKPEVTNSINRFDVLYFVYISFSETGFLYDISCKVLVG